MRTHKDSFLKIAVLMLISFLSTFASFATSGEVNDSIALPKDKTITSIVFQKGSVGCFHKVETTLTYKLKEDAFVKSKKKVVGKKDYFLKKMPKRIAKTSVQELYNNIYKSSLNEKDDFSFVLKDEERQYYKRLIDEELEFLHMSPDEYKGKEYTDYYEVSMKKLKYMSSCIDTLNFPLDLMQEGLMAKPDFVCTTSDYVIISLCFDDGEVLTLKSSDYNTHYLHCPWNANYNDKSFLVKSFATGKCIDDMTNGTYMPECNTTVFVVDKMLDFCFYRDINEYYDFHKKASLDEISIQNLIIEEKEMEEDD